MHASESQGSAGAGGVPTRAWPHLRERRRGYRDRVRDDRQYTPLSVWIRKFTLPSQLHRHHKYLFEMILGNYYTCDKINPF